MRQPPLLTALSVAGAGIGLELYPARENDL